MNVYIIYNEDNKVIAYTDDKEVLESYLFNINKIHNKNYSFKKIKLKNIKNKEIYDDLYLIKYNDTYIPQKYYQYIELVDSKETKECIEYLMKELSIRDNLGKKKRKIIEKMIMLLEEWYEEDMEYTPDDKELEILEDHYKPYLDEIGNSKYY